MSATSVMTASLLAAIMSIKLDGADVEAADVKVELVEPFENEELLDTTLVVVVRPVEVVLVEVEALMVVLVLRVDVAAGGRA